MKLAAKLMLLFLLAVVAITALFSFLTIRQDTTDFTQEHEQRAADLVESMKPHLLDAWKEGGHDEVDQVLRISTERVRQTSVRYYRVDDDPPGGADDQCRPRRGAELSLDSNGRVDDEVLDVELDPRAAPNAVRSERQRPLDDQTAEAQVSRRAQRGES